MLELPLVLPIKLLKLVIMPFEEHLSDNFTAVLRPEARLSAETRYLGWNVAPEDLPHIPEHWLKYPEPEASLHYLLGLLYIAFTIFALVGNGLVIWVFSS